MRDLLLKMYFLLRRLPEDHPLSAAVAVVLAMLEKDDFLAAHAALIPGDPNFERLPFAPLDTHGDIATAVGAAIALNAKGQGSVVVAPLNESDLQSAEFPELMSLALNKRLPLILLSARKDADDEALPETDESDMDELERIEADGQDAMRLMPALRLAIDKAREGDGPTLIECVNSPADDEEAVSAAKRLAGILITEGYATPEELI